MPSHGSLTKAGKVRSQTPKVEAKKRKKESPRVRNRVEYDKREKRSREENRRGRMPPRQRQQPQQAPAQ